MNLFWLKYVSYACLACAAFFYVTLRLKRLKLSRATQLTLYSLFIVLTCATWCAEEWNADHHSPRELVVGSVVGVTVQEHRGGISDDFKLMLSSGSLSPQFSTQIVADSAADQPIHQGDLLGVLYRTWDNVPVTIDELQGAHEGWNYRGRGEDNRFAEAVAFAGAIGFVVLFFVSRNWRAGAAKPETTLNLND